MKSESKPRAKPLQTDAAVRAWKPASLPAKRSAGRGLYLFISGANSKIWRMNYSYGPKGARRQKTLVLGHWPDMDIEAAQAARNAAKRHLKGGRDPSRAAATDGMATFEEVAREWLSTKRTEWAPRYAGLVERRLEADIFPAFGQTPLGAVRKADVLAALKAVGRPPDQGGRGAMETAHRLLEYVRAIIRSSDDENVADITLGLRQKLGAKPTAQNFKRFGEHELGPFLRKLDSGHMEPLTRLAIKLTFYTAARTSEVIGARWEEFEKLARPEEALWRIPAHRMKEGREHQIYLSAQAIEIVEEVRKISGEGEYLFPKADGRPGTMSNNSMLYALYGLGYRNKATIHGARAAFSTIANGAVENDVRLWEPEWVEVALSHVVGGKVHRAYNAAQYKPERRRMSQWWADKLDTLKENEKFGVTQILR